MLFCLKCASNDLQFKAVSGSRFLSLYILHYVMRKAFVSSFVPPNLIIDKNE